jgi:hypothetical protein
MVTTLQELLVNLRDSRDTIYLETQQLLTANGRQNLSRVYRFIRDYKGELSPLFQQVDIQLSQATLDEVFGALQACEDARKTQSSLTISKDGFAPRSNVLTHLLSRDAKEIALDVKYDFNSETSKPFDICTIAELCRMDTLFLQRQLRNRVWDAMSPHVTEKGILKTVVTKEDFSLLEQYSSTGETEIQIYNYNTAHAFLTQMTERVNDKDSSEMLSEVDATDTSSDNIFLLQCIAEDLLKLVRLPQTPVEVPR